MVGEEEMSEVEESGEQAIGAVLADTVDVEVVEK